MNRNRCGADFAFVSPDRRSDSLHLYALHAPQTGRNRFCGCCRRSNVPPHDLVRCGHSIPSDLWIGRTVLFVPDFSTRPLFRVCIAHTARTLQDRWGRELLILGVSILLTAPCISDFGVLQLGQLHLVSTSGEAFRGKFARFQV